MKTIIRNTILLTLAIMALHVKAQLTINLCAGSSTVITAINSLGLSSPTYSLNPGGITSSSPAFTVAPASSTTYTLYVTGINSSAAIQTTSNTVNVMWSPLPFLTAFANSYTLGCGATSIAVITVSGQTNPPGGTATYTCLPPGSSTVLPASGFGFTSTYTTNIPGSWLVGIRNQAPNSCTTWSTVNLSLNITPPAITPISQTLVTCSNTMGLIQIAPNPAVHFFWLPYSGTPGNTINTTANLAAPTQSIAMTLTLLVIDNSNLCQSTTVVPVYQNLYEPIATIVPGSLPSMCTSTVNLINASNSGVPPGTFSTAMVYATLWEGPAPQPTAGIIPTYVAYTPGIYTMTVLDPSNGCTKTATYNVSETTLRPVAAFTHTVTSGVAVFNNVSTLTNSISTYSWDFGDGNTSNLQNPTHTYVSGGAHLVKLKVTKGGLYCADSIIQSVNVSGIPCIANSGFSMAPTATAQNWNVIPDYPWNITAASWSWGDGSVSNTLYTSHQYSAAGMYNICLSVTVSCVASSSSCTTYSVYRTSQAAMILNVNVIPPALISGLASTEADGQFSWNIVPNPNEGAFKLNLDNAKPESVRILIYDLTGRMVHDQLIEPYATSISVHTGNLPPGMYLVRLETGNLKVTKRMVVYH